MSFPPAARVFTDPLALLEQHVVDGEVRRSVTGTPDGLQTLFVDRVVREERDGETIRILSARLATRKEGNAIKTQMVR